jgi:transposase
MGKRQSLSIDIKQKIIKMNEDGIKQKLIAENFKISPNTVCVILKNYKKNKILGGHKPGAGRKRITTKYDERIMKRMIDQNRFTTVIDLKNNLQESNINISRATVHRRIKELKFSSYKAKSKPLLTLKQRKKRLDWCRTHKQKDQHFWRKIFWSDESYFEIPIGKKGKVWRRKNEEFIPKCTTKSVKHPGGVMVWGCMGYNGLAKLVIVKNKINSIVYQGILTEGLIPSISNNFPNEDSTDEIIFQQDLAPPHNSKSTKDWLNNQNINVLPWPANSPDLNPIENVWRKMKFSINRSNPRPKNKSELIELITKVWNEFSLRDCRNLIDSMPKRINTVIKSKGYPTKY